jgi:hypothetical protein
MPARVWPVACAWWTHPSAPITSAATATSVPMRRGPKAARHPDPTRTSWSAAVIAAVAAMTRITSAG